MLVGGLRVLPMHSGRERDVEAVEQDEGDCALLEEVQAVVLHFLRVRQLGDDVGNASHNHLREQDEQHDVAVVDEVACHSHILERRWHLPRFVSDAHIQSVHHLQTGQRSQIHVQESVLRQREVGQLQHSEQFQSHNLAAEEGEQQCHIADDFVREHQILHILLTPAFRLGVVEWRDERIVVDAESLAGRHLESDGLVEDVARVFGMDDDVLFRLLLLDVFDVDSLIQYSDAILHYLVHFVNHLHLHHESIAALLFNRDELRLVELAKCIARVEKVLVVFIASLASSRVQT